METESERETQAREFLKKHKIKELFDNLASLLIYNRPGKSQFEGRARIVCS